MKPHGDQTTEAAGAPDDAVTGLPGLRTWRRVYVLVFGIFVLWVGLLTLLTLVFS